MTDETKLIKGAGGGPPKPPPPPYRAPDTYIVEVLLQFKT